MTSDLEQICFEIRLTPLIFLLAPSIVLIIPQNIILELLIKVRNEFVHGGIILSQWTYLFTSINTPSDIR